MADAPGTPAKGAPSADLHLWSATDLAAAIVARQVSPVEVMRAVLDRAAAVEPSLNLFATLTAEAAMVAARAAEQDVMAGARLGPLHGVPITIKDNVAVRGVPMANGSMAAPAILPEAAAIVATRVLQAGAIMVGKTNLPEFAHKVLTDSPAFGITRNPWNLLHTPGGSSGGASAALAAGVAPLAIGTDGGGSIRCPASCTGVLGLKATLGRIPNETFPDGFASYAFVGPMTRTAADLALLTSVMAGPSAADPYAVTEFGDRPGLPRRPLDGLARGLRVGWIPHVGATRTDPAVLSLTRAAVLSLEQQGAAVEEIADPCFDDVFATYVVIATVAHATRLGALAAAAAERMDASLRASIAQGATYSATDLQRAGDRRTALFRSVQRLFERFDIIATPTLTAPPPRVDAGGSVASEMYAQWAAPLYPFNLTGHPAVSVPAGLTGEGLPVGLQLVAPWHAEQRLLDLCMVLEQHRGSSVRRPPI